MQKIDIFKRKIFVHPNQKLWNFLFIVVSKQNIIIELNLFNSYIFLNFILQ